MSNAERIKSGLSRRYAAERRFRLYGIAAILLALGFLGVMLSVVIGRGASVLQQAYVQLPATVTAETVEMGNWQGVIKATLRQQFPDVRKRQAKKRLYGLVSPGAGYILRQQIEQNPEWIGQRRTYWLPASDDVDMLLKGIIDRTVAESERRISNQELVWIDQFVASGQLQLQFNKGFFTSGDSREPELAGILGAAVGSALSLLVCLVLAFPLGVMTAVHLEEFAPKNRWTDLIEVNINNLAAVPSIVFGLLGLAVFLNVFGLPRSAPLVGGMVLALMTLPTIIIAARAALKSVPPSIRQAAMAMGASPVQVVLHHVLPSAMPGMLTGTIIGMAQALGETAPLLMIGMVAFIVDIPQGILEPATALPVQIFLWADAPERAFGERTAAAILVLLIFLVLMNLTAVILRKRFERRW
ncbi:MAG TPA: phosphate ABC transporter permease PstA [Rhodospirillales bacterium]|nr:phosphate ABC transporter permease PstA [Rhodospirillales bacterium]